MTVDELGGLQVMVQSVSPEAHVINMHKTQ